MCMYLHLSTYHLLVCQNCKHSLGRMYRTTSPELDQWRGFYTFSSESLAFYELSAELPSTSSSGAPPIANAISGLPDPTVLATEQQQQQQQQQQKQSPIDSMEITKLQKFCLYLYDRVNRLEEELRTPQRSADGRITDKPATDATG